MDTRKKTVKPWLRREKIYVPNSDSDSDPEPTSKTLREYGNATTVHGIPYILEAGRNPVERLLWIIFVGIGAGTATYLSFNIYQDWQNQQVITSVGTTGYNIENIQFPSITICAQGSIKKVTGKYLFSCSCEKSEQRKTKAKTKTEALVDPCLF